MQMSDPTIVVVPADLANSAHQQAILRLTNEYACDPMGNGHPLPDEVLQNLITGLKEHPTTLIFVAYIDEKPVGIATCFVGFSTFAAKPLINVHDLAVTSEYRGCGVGRALLMAVEEEARRRDCAKLTLEVQENNQPARGLYESVGFAQAVYGAKTGGSLFYSKPLKR
jgi:GNAT superfamily N-acetyltransferase